MGYALAYASCYALGVFYTGFALSGNAQTTTIFEAKFGWDEDETIFYNTLISSAAIVGLTAGAFIGGPLIKLGRRRGAIISNFIGIISAAIPMIGSIPFLVIGRFLLGFASGINNVVYGKMIVETLPERLAQKFAMLQSVSICFGILAAFAMGAILPDPKDFEANEADENWRVIYLMPAFISIFQIVLITLFFRHESIAFCIAKGEKQQSKQHMLRVYRKADPSSP